MQKFPILFVVTFIIGLDLISSIPLGQVALDYNSSSICDFTTNKERLSQRNKRANLENALRRIKDSTQDLGKNIYDHINYGFRNLANKNPINADDIRQYEELVIMKKNPYLDIKELEMKYNGPLSSKNARQSAKFTADRYVQNEPDICESGEDKPNVEIINRGLSGFLIPTHISKHFNTLNNPIQNNLKTVNGPCSNKSVDINVLQSLKEDINVYVGKKIVLK